MLPALSTTLICYRLTPLDWAATADNEGMVKFLLEQGADPNLSHALFSAARNGDLAMAGLLLEHGADPYDRTKLSVEEREAVENIDPYKARDPYLAAINSHHNDVANLIKSARK